MTQFQQLVINLCVIQIFIRIRLHYSIIPIQIAKIKIIESSIYQIIIINNKILYVNSSILSICIHISFIYNSEHSNLWGNLHNKVPSSWQRFTLISNTLERLSPSPVSYCNWYTCLNISQRQLKLKWWMHEIHTNYICLLIILGYHCTFMVFWTYKTMIPLELIVSNTHIHWKKRYWPIFISVISYASILRCVSRKWKISYIVECSYFYCSDILTSFLLLVYSYNRK